MACFSAAEFQVMVINHQVPFSEWHPQYIDNEQTVLVLSGKAGTGGGGKRGGGDGGGDGEQRLVRRSLTKRLKGGA